MTTILLTGAGFTRNWGGWLASEAFEYLLGCPEIAASREARGLLWRFKDSGGFEAALAEVQLRWTRDPRAHQAELDAMQSAIQRLFTDMNAALLAINAFEFQQSRDYQVAAALVRFDAIFTLNQDLLLEHHYLNDNVSLLSNGRWNGYQLPGLAPSPRAGFEHLHTPAGQQFMPVAPNEFRVHAGAQALFKLHGSSNWIERVAGPILVMGGRKEKEIEFHPILNWYMGKFEEMAWAGGTRLMVIGYGFRDAHINRVIEKGANEFGLRLFVIDPSGADVAWRVNPSRAPGAAIGAESSLESAFKLCVEGASRRSLREIFGGDRVEHAKVMRFLA
jgi:SIR2-like domain